MKNLSSVSPCPKSELITDHANIYFEKMARKISLNKN